MSDSTKEECMNKFKFKVRGLTNVQQHLSSFFYQQTNLYFLKCCKSFEISPDQERRIKVNDYYLQHINYRGSNYFNTSYQNVFIAECLFPVVNEKTDMNSDFYIDIHRQVTNSIILYKNLWNFDKVECKNQITRNLKYFSYYTESKLFNKIKRRIKLYMTIKCNITTCKSIYCIYNKPAIHIDDIKYRFWTIVKLKKNFMFDKFILRYFDTELFDHIKTLQSKKVVRKRTEKKNWYYG
jgi:hypothetical protein